MIPSRPFAITAGVVFAILGLGVGVARAQSASAPLATELTQLLQEASLDTVAAKDAGSENRFGAAMLLGGAQLLVVSAEYSVPELLAPMLAEKNYREVYLELQSAFVPETKYFVSDFAADGLAREPSGDVQVADTYEAAGARTMFDKDWRAQSLSEDDYDIRFGEADAMYAQILQMLIGELK